ncbi:MAG: hypothetical protein JWN98_1781 [Abditibacteriota bacterium]|nr:hypothetical protein [Abditibacteriota bacterium]
MACPYNFLMISADRNHPAWIFWDSIADAVNPGLVLLLIAATWLSSRHRTDLPQNGRIAFFFGFLGRALLAILVVYLLAHLPRWLHWNPFQSKFPSGHTAFAASVVTSLWLLDARSKYFGLPLLAAYAALIVALGHHIWIDIVGALILAPPIGVWCHRWRSTARQAITA